jgi:hypothetical protein
VLLKGRGVDDKQRHEFLKCGASSIIPSPPPPPPQPV